MHDDCIGVCVFLLHAGDDGIHPWMFSIPYDSTLTPIVSVNARAMMTFIVYAV
jgi:hypothetical protein